MRVLSSVSCLFLISCTSFGIKPRTPAAELPKHCRALLHAMSYKNAESNFGPQGLLGYKDSFNQLSNSGYIIEFRVNSAVECQQKVMDFITQLPAYKWVDKETNDNNFNDDSDFYFPVFEWVFDPPGWMNEDYGLLTRWSQIENTDIRQYPNTEDIREYINQKQKSAEEKASAVQD